MVKRSFPGPVRAFMVPRLLFSPRDSARGQVPSEQGQRVHRKSKQTCKLRSSRGQLSRQEALSSVTAMPALRAFHLSPATPRLAPPLCWSLFLCPACSPVVPPADSMALLKSHCSCLFQGTLSRASPQRFP